MNLREKHMTQRKKAKARLAREEPYKTSRPQESGSTQARQGVNYTGLRAPQQIADASLTSKTRRSFKRRGNLRFLSLPLEVRHMVYEFLLVSVADRLVTMHFGRFMPGLGHAGMRDHHSLLLTCHTIHHEAINLLYSWPVYARGFDLPDFCVKSRLSLHPWLLKELQLIQVLRIRFSLLHCGEDFTGNSEIFLCTLPKCRILRIDLMADDWRVACNPAFVDFVRDLDKQGGVEVRLCGAFQETNDLDAEMKRRLLKLIENAKS